MIAGIIIILAADAPTTTREAEAVVQMRLLQPLHHQPRELSEWHEEVGDWSYFNTLALAQALTAFACVL